MLNIFNIKQNDTSPAIRYTLSPLVNLTGATVVFNMRARDNGAVKIARAVATIIAPATDGVVQYDWAASDTDTAGNWQGEFEITFADAAIETYPNNGYINIQITEEIG